MIKFLEFRELFRARGKARRLTYFCGRKLQLTTDYSINWRWESSNEAAEPWVTGAKKETPETTFRLLWRVFPIDAMKFIEGGRGPGFERLV